jgi:hypothetical protein
MVIAGHVSDDLGCADSSACLLKNALRATETFCKVEENSVVEGSYLYFDMERCQWVRSGKAVGRSLYHRHKEHLKSASLSTGSTFDSKFYMSYPCRTATYTDTTRRGFFESLQQYSALAFDRAQHKQSATALQNTREHSLFVWSQSDMKSLKAVGFAGNPSIGDRQLHLIGYLCEIGYDLALAPDNNMSESPGFETPLGIFGGSRN